MALSDTQVRQLRAKLDGRHVKTRCANGTDLHYVEGWHVIAEANHIFGYDAWDRRTLASHCVWSGTSGAYHGAAYAAKVRVSVRAGDITIVREGSGTGEGKAPTPGQAHELALREDQVMALSDNQVRQRGEAAISIRRSRRLGPLMPKASFARSGMTVESLDLSRASVLPLQLQPDRPAARQVGVAVELQCADVVVGAHTPGDRQALVSLHVPDLVDAAAGHVIDPPGP